MVNQAINSLNFQCYLTLLKSSALLTPNNAGKSTKPMISMHLKNNNNREILFNKTLLLTYLDSKWFTECALLFKMLMGGDACTSSEEV